MRIYFERISYNGNIILVEKTQKIISVKTTFIIKSQMDAGQDGCRTDQMQDRSDAVNYSIFN